MKACNKRGHVRRDDGRCATCKRLAGKLYRKANSVAIRAKNKAYTARGGPGYEAKRAESRRRYGIPEPTRPCPDSCECCGDLPGKKALSADHDHVTGLFRGWLCLNCNIGIGKLGDCKAGLALATSYLNGVIYGQLD